MTNLYKELHCAVRVEERCSHSAIDICSLKTHAQQFGDCCISLCSERQR